MIEQEEIISENCRWLSFILTVKVLNVTSNVTSEMNPGGRYDMYASGINVNEVVHSNFDTDVIGCPKQRKQQINKGTRNCQLKFKNKEAIWRPICPLLVSIVFMTNWGMWYCSHYNSPLPYKILEIYYIPYKRLENVFALETMLLTLNKLR